MDKKMKVLFSGACLVVVVLVGGMYSTISQYKDMIENKEKSIQSLEDEVDTLSEKNKKDREKLDQTVKEFELAEKDKKELDETINSLKEKIEKAEKDKKKLQNQLQKEKNRAQKVSKEKNKSTEVKKEEPSTGGKGFQTFQATAYCGCRKCNGKWTGKPTASGTNYVAGRTIAVDPNVIPLGTKVQVAGMGTFIAEDTGSAIKGNIVDIYFNSHSEAMRFGRQSVKVKVP